MNITWTRGRISHASSGTLATGIANYTYTYNAKGQLIRKNYTYFPGQQAMTRYIQTKTIDYTYDTSNQLIQEYRYTTYNDGSTYTQRLTYFYDAMGISSCEYTSDTTTNLYHFNKNIQGDVTEIFHQNGTLVGKYLYDAYGNATITDDTSGGFVTTNPFRYRGYYYDTDLQLYFLQTRHYDPKTGRFISPDTVDYLDPESTSGLNLYAYCNNDPVNHYDPSGHVAISTIILIACVIAGAVTGGTYAGVTAYEDGARGWELIGWTALGVIGGGAIGGLVGFFAGPIAGSLLGSGGLALAGGAGILGGSTVGTLGATLVAGGAIAGTVAGALIGSNILMFAKNSKLSGKTTSSNRPSWVNGDMIDPSLSAQQNATNLLNQKYGPGNWRTGPTSEYNKIVKWIERWLKFYRGW